MARRTTEGEIASLKRAVANLTVDKLILEKRPREISEPRVPTEVRGACTSTTRGHACRVLG